MTDDEKYVDFFLSQFPLLAESNGQKTENWKRGRLYVCVPHVSAGRLQADVAAVLEGGRVAGQHGLLADHAAAAHGLQRAAQREDAPVSLAQLHRLRAQVLQPDAVAPLHHI